jgi:archaellum biogenesis protein FlaJ (TadC family)
MRFSDRVRAWVAAAGPITTAVIVIVIAKVTGLDLIGYLVSLAVGAGVSALVGLIVRVSGQAVAPGQVVSGPIKPWGLTADDPRRQDSER